MSVMSTDHHSGLEEVQAVESTISSIKGTQLQLRGIPINELAEKSTFEETAYLLWNQRLPGETELTKFSKELKESAAIPYEIQEMINHIPRQVHPMSALRTLVSALALYDHEADKMDTEALFRQAMRVMARIPTLVAAFERHRKAKVGVIPRDDLNFSANFLYMLYNEEPDSLQVKALEKSLILYAEHELNASTFTARVVTGTMADLYSAITGAMSSLMGVLHGGANQAAMDTILEIGDPGDTAEWVKGRLEAKEKIMGFGHRVYKEGDPRVPLLRQVSAELAGTTGNQQLHEVAEALEEAVKKEKALHANVDLYSGLIYYMLGFANDSFTSVFAMARCAGWAAHIMEQRQNNRLIRPRAHYAGLVDQAYKPVSER